MNRLMKRLEKLEDTHAVAAARRACDQSSRVQSALKQIRRMALRSMSIKELELLCDRMRSERKPSELTVKQSDAINRLRAALDSCALKVSGQPVSTLAAKIKSVELPTAREIECELATKSLRHFIRFAWDTVEPAKPYIHNWHIDCIAEHLEKVTQGKIRRLLINIPPGHAKSLLVSVLWPAWVWIQPEAGPGGPKWRSMFASYATELSLRDSIKCRMLIASEWYQRLFQPGWQLSEVQNAKGHFMNTAMGFRLATSVGGRGTGFRGDCVVADDPLNAKEAYSLAAREEVIYWWDHVMSSRLNDKRTGGMVIFALDDLPEKWHSYVEKNSSYVEGGKFQPDKYQAA